MCGAALQNVKWKLRICNAMLIEVPVDGRKKEKETEKGERERESGEDCEKYRNGQNKVSVMSVSWKYFIFSVCAALFFRFASNIYCVYMRCNCLVEGVGDGGGCVFFSVTIFISWLVN